MESRSYRERTTFSWRLRGKGGRPKGRPPSHYLIRLGEEEMMADAVQGTFILQEAGSPAPNAIDGWYASEYTILTEHTLLVKYIEENPEVLN